FQAEDGIRDATVTGVQTCALPIYISFVDMSDLSAVERALRSKTKLAWMETPSNPLLKIVDLAAVAQIVRGTGAICVCDNTWAPRSEERRVGKEGRSRSDGEDEREI